MVPALLGSQAKGHHRPNLECQSLAFEGVAPTVRDRTLREEARSIDHSLTHKPNIKYCDVGIRTRSRQVYLKTGAYQRETHEWGDIVTADHIDCCRAERIGLDDEREAFVIRDILSGMFQGFPLLPKSRKIQ